MAASTNTHSQEVATIDHNHPIVKAIVDGTIPEVVDADAMSSAMALRILEADHDEAFRLRQATPMSELLTHTHSVGQDGTENRCTPPLEIRGVSWQKSDFASNGGIYAIVDAVNLETGETMVLTCGGRFLMAGLYRLQMDGTLPATMQAVEVGRSRPGESRALRLVIPEN